MTCNEFEALLADALGNELSPPDRPAFEAHMANCVRCRAEFESSAATIDAMSRTPAPPAVMISRVGERLVIGPGKSASSRASHRPFAALRYAAAIVAAFGAGYAAHMYRTEPAQNAINPPIAHAPALPHEASLESAMVAAYSRKPDRPSLSICMSALFPEGKTR